MIHKLSCPSCGGLRELDASAGVFYHLWLSYLLRNHKLKTKHAVAVSNTIYFALICSVAISLFYACIILFVALSFFFAFWVIITERE